MSDTFGLSQRKVITRLSEIDDSVIGELALALAQAGGLRIPISQIQGYENISPAWTSYTPALTATTTNPTLGTSPTQTGKYLQLGKLILGYAVIVFGTGAPTAGTGTYRLSIPVAASVSGPKAGMGDLLDNSANLVRLCGVERATTTTLQLRIDNTGLGLVTNAVPWTWAANDQISIFFAYEAA